MTELVEKGHAPNKNNKKNNNGPCQADRRNHDRIGFYHKIQKVLAPGWHQNPITPD